MELQLLHGIIWGKGKETKALGQVPKLQFWSKTGL